MRVSLAVEFLIAAIVSQPAPPPNRTLVLGAFARSVLSVVPQTVIYRASFFSRYRPLFRSDWSRILTSAASFSWLHIVMGNALAPLLTLPAGLVFAWRYARTGSVVVSAVEHALYGCLIFTVGLGEYFYTGAAR